MATPGRSRPRPLSPVWLQAITKQAVVVGPGRQMAHPGTIFFLGVSPGGGVGNEDHLGPVERHAGAQFGEVGIVAELNAEGHSADLKQGDVVSRAENRLLGGGDMQFAVDPRRPSGKAARWLA